MKIQFGSIVVAGSGKIGGHVASRNKAGAYLRTKVTPVNPSTAYQQAARGLLASLSTQWSGLTDAQRFSFNDAVSQFAKTDIFGDIKNPSGFNLFVKLNSNLVNSGQAQITTAPEKIEIPFSPISAILMDVSDSSLDVNFGDAALDGAKVMVWATPPLSAGTSFAKNKLRLIGTYTVAAATLDAGADYIARFGAFTAGANIQVQVRAVVATGQVSAPQGGTATVTA
jgi:hypothetical protein